VAEALLHDSEAEFSDELRSLGIDPEMVFSPRARLLPFSKSPIVDELIQRVDATRRR